MEAGLSMRNPASKDAVSSILTVGAQSDEDKNIFAALRHYRIYTVLISLPGDCFSNDPSDPKGPKLKAWQEGIGNNSCIALDV